VNDLNLPFSDKTIEALFEKYSYPIVHPCETNDQREKAIDIAKALWLLLITGEDSEENIYAVLYKLFNNHSDAISLGSLYYYKMKKALNKKQIRKLKKYYEIPDNFNVLGSWRRD
jgi:hypothetical protein